MAASRLNFDGIKKRFIHKVISITMIIFFLFSNSVLTNNLTNDLSFYASKSISSKNESRDSFSSIADKISYSPINESTGTGSNFISKDIVTVYDNQYLNLSFNEGTEVFDDSYSIDNITGYDIYDLKYNITSIEAKTDWYAVENDTDDTLETATRLRYNTYIALAQGFEIPWDYGVFKGAKIFLGDDGNVGTNILEILLVKADLSGQPNMSYVYSSDINDPYSQANTIPVSTIDNLHYYDFSDVVIERGFYFVVANLSNPASSAKDFLWYKNTVAPYKGDSYQRQSSGNWELNPSIDFTFIPELLPSDETGNPRIFTDPTDISLQDNSVDILSLASPILDTGFHYLTSDTSVEIYFNNSYSFYIDEVVNSSFIASNSSYGEFSINWNLTWSIEQLDYSPYTIFERILLINTPSDWSVSPLCFINDSIPIMISQVINGYMCYLNSEATGGNLKIETTSTNYLQQLVLTENSVPTTNFTLGYWTNDGSTASGFVGSTISAEVQIQDSISTGTVNFTLFNPDGLINPLKTGLPANLSYTDTTPYTIGGITSSGPGVFSTSTAFDPSVYGTDLAGEWTAFVLWTNGTEIGISTTTIFLQSSTEFNVEWEELPGNNNWISDTISPILRENGDNLKIRAEFFTNSEPFFTEVGFTIPTAELSYYTSWSTSDFLDNNNPFFNTTIIPNATAKAHTITITANCGVCIPQVVVLDIEIFNTYSIEVNQPVIEINGTQDVLLMFSMINETDPMKSAIFPDNVDVSINSNPITSQFYNVSSLGESVIIGLKLVNYGLGVGNHYIQVSLTKQNFREDYSDLIISYIFTIKILDTSTPSELPGYIIGVIVGSVVLITTLLALLYANSRNRRKDKKPIIDVSNKAKNVALFESVLSLRKILFIHSESSLPVFELDLGHVNNVDTSLVSGFLSVVSQMGKSIGGSQTGDIRKIEYKNFVVNGASSETYTVFLFSTDDIINDFKAWLFDLIMWFEYQFKINQRHWDGQLEVFKTKKRLIEDKVAESLYLWFYFPMEVNSRKFNDVRKIEGINQKIVIYANKKQIVSLSEILTKFKETAMEEILNTVFKMVNAGFLKRKFFESYQGE